MVVLCFSKTIKRTQSSTEFARSFTEKGIWRFAVLVWLSCSMFVERGLSYNTQRNVFFSEKLRANTT
jgi:hypothetical protein